MKSGNEYTRKDLQKLACTLGMLYLNQPDSNILLEGIMYERDNKQHLIDLLYTEGELLKAEINAAQNS